MRPLRTSFLPVFWALLVTLTFGFVPPAEAAGVKIQPAIIEERLDPGKAFSTTLRVTNLDDVPRTYFLLVKDVEDVDGSGKPTFTDAENPLYGISRWVTLDRKSIEVGAHETKEVSVVITAPLDAAPGGHFGGIFASLDAVRPAETGVGIGYEIGTIISLRIAGEVAEEARIREFRTERAVYDAPSVSFIARVENLGNVLVRPRGPIEITNMFGRKAGVVLVNEDGASIFPKKEREFSVAWTSDNVLAMGRYQATMSLVYGEDGRKTITEAVSFWVLPIKILGSVFAGLLAVIVLGYVGIRMYIRKKIREAQGGAAARGASESLPSSRLLFLTIGAVIFVLALLFGVFFLFS
jgi:hypothetical protein